MGEVDPGQRLAPAAKAPPRRPSTAMAKVPAPSIQAPPPPSPPASPSRQDRGNVYAAVRADIAQLGKQEGGARGSLAALALSLAERYDQLAADAGLAAVAKAAQELRACLVALTSEHHDDAGDIRQLTAALSTPVGNPSDAGTSDAGSARREDS